ncbi:4-oxalocrotonate tautomerase family protein [Promicromonospora alba]|uniref:4-oxalocrotonate tautomerase family protein n=1 Tax=Promicromonospora alba TaxID=1616110 RepID=A0ABV9HN24_9MICO
MTVITVTARENRFTVEQRRELARTLTDAVLVPEVGQLAEPARAGFQVHFLDLPTDRLAIGGALAADTGADVMRIDVAVMDSHWPQDVRSRVIENVFAALTAATGEPKPSPAWWVNFRVIDEGSWGSRGRTLSVHDLLDSGVFTEEKAAAVRATTPRFAG